MNDKNVVGQAADAKSEIEQSAAEIAKIIGISDENAFQNNLLALNARVEVPGQGK